MSKQTTTTRRTFATHSCVFCCARFKRTNRHTTLVHLHCAPALPPTLHSCARPCHGAKSAPRLLVAPIEWHRDTVSIALRRINTKPVRSSERARHKPRSVVVAPSRARAQLRRASSLHRCVDRRLAGSCALFHAQRRCRPARALATQRAKSRSVTPLFALAFFRFLRFFHFLRQSAAFLQLE